MHSANLRTGLTVIALSLLGSTFAPFSFSIASAQSPSNTIAQASSSFQRQRFFQALDALYKARTVLTSKAEDNQNRNIIRALDQTNLAINYTKRTILVENDPVRSGSSQINIPSRQEDRLRAAVLYLQEARSSLSQTDDDRNVNQNRLLALSAVNTAINSLPGAGNPNSNSNINTRACASLRDALYNLNQTNSNFQSALSTAPNERRQWVSDVQQLQNNTVTNINQLRSAIQRYCDTR